MSLRGICEGTSLGFQTVRTITAAWSRGRGGGGIEGFLLDQRQANAGSFAQLEKARLVAKLKAARDRKREATGRCEGRKSYADAMPATVALAKQLHADGLSYRKISAELAAQGHVTGSGKHHVASAVQKMLGR